MQGGIHLKKVPRQGVKENPVIWGAKETDIKGKKNLGVCRQKTTKRKSGTWREKKQRGDVLETPQPWWGATRELFENVGKKPRKKRH